MSELERVRALDVAGRRAEGRARNNRVERPPQRPEPTPRSRAAPGGPLELHTPNDGPARWFLDGAPLQVGDPIEVYTTAANGWVRGRLEWSGHPEDPARLAVNVWDPDGPRDEDGLPPWVGDLDAPLPRGARVRRAR